MCFGVTLQLQGVCKIDAAKALSAHMVVDCCCLRLKPGHHSVHDCVSRQSSNLSAYVALDQMFSRDCIPYVHDHIITSAKDSVVVLQELFELQQLKLVSSSRLVARIHKAQRRKHAY